ncbi:MAG: hypothetical protein LBS40_08725 [Burkholderiales bacterium]|jgi:hypothetical protein|nr:hypothetical protein [Burkholderiales bacterium]
MKWRLNGQAESSHPNQAPSTKNTGNVLALVSRRMYTMNFCLPIKHNAQQHRLRGLILGVFLSLFSLGTASAQSVITLYQQDFETPNNGWGDAQCTSFGDNAHLGGVSASYTGQGGVPFYQVNSADRLCITKVGSTDDIVDPAATGGNYAIGFHGSSATVNTIESIGFIFDPQGFKFLSGTFDASWIGLPTFSSTTYGFVQDTDYPVTLQFYEIPNGTPNTSVNIQVPTNLGGNAPVRIDATTLTPFASQVETLSNGYSEAQRFTLDWKEIDFTVDMTSMAADSRVMMVLTGLPQYRYLVVDNLNIVATLSPPTDYSIAPVPVNGPAYLLLLTLALAGFGTYMQRRR